MYESVCELLISDLWPAAGHVCLCSLTVAVHVWLQIIDHLSLLLQVRMSLMKLHPAENTHTTLKQHLMSNAASQRLETLTDAPPASSLTATTVGKEKQIRETVTDDILCSSQHIYNTVTISVQSESRRAGGRYLQWPEVADDWSIRRSGWIKTDEQELISSPQTNQLQISHTNQPDRDSETLYREVQQFCIRIRWSGEWYYINHKQMEITQSVLSEKIRL